jgi:mutator protein MutT
LKPELQNSIEVAAGLVFRDGRLLITQRHETDSLGGFWEFPGGKRKAHETFEACLQRELLEELGIEVQVRGLVFESRYAYPEKTVYLQFFYCAWLRGEPQALGCHRFAWVEPGQLGGYDFLPADAQLVRRLPASPQWWR